MNIFHPLVIALLAASTPFSYGVTHVFMTPEESSVLGRGTSKKSKKSKKSEKNECKSSTSSKSEMEETVLVKLTFGTDIRAFETTSDMSPKIVFYPLDSGSDAEAVIESINDLLPAEGETVTYDFELPYYFKCGMSKFHLLAGSDDAWLINSATIQVGEGGEVEMLPLATVDGGANAIWLEGRPHDLETAGFSVSDEWVFTAAGASPEVGNPGGYCTGSDPETCGCLSLEQTDYAGTQSTTSSGKTCQAWDSNSPHSHDYNYIGSHNYCRNPDGEDKAWCYTTDENERFELCDVPACGASS
eukprot:scaffold106227_cov30-Attheya_sp.AAC.1